MVYLDDIIIFTGCLQILYVEKKKQEKKESFYQEKKKGFFPNKRNILLNCT